jgi:hypothetical protein
MQVGLTIPIEDYHSDISRISKSGLDLINKSPAHYYYRYLDPLRSKEKEKDWAVDGNAFGCAIGEPDEFPQRYGVIDDLEICREIGGARPTSTNRYKDWFATESIKMAGKIVIDIAAYNQYISMRDAVRANPAAKIFLSKGIAERTFYFKDPDTGVDCRVRPDWLADNGYTVDFKTTEDASPAGFGRSAFKFRYPCQGAFYGDGLKHNGLKSKGFVYIVCEKSPPYFNAVYFLQPEAEKIGRLDYKADLSTFAECKANNKWPSYGEVVMPLQLPRYAYTRND